MIQDREETRALSRMSCEAQEGIPIGPENLVEESLGAQALRRGRLGGGVPEEEVVLREPGLDGIGGKVLEDVGEGAATVAGMNVNALPQELLDFGDKGELAREVEAIERVPCGLQAAGHGAGVVALRGLDVLRLDQLLPQRVDILSLCNAEIGEVGVPPGDSRIAIQLGVVALGHVSGYGSQIYSRVKKFWEYRYAYESTSQKYRTSSITYVPGWGSKVALCIIMEPIAVPTDEEHFVLHVSGGVEVEQVHLIGKPFPLALSPPKVEHSVAVVGAIDQTKIGGNLPRHCQQLRQLRRENGIGVLRNRSSTG